MCWRLPYRSRADIVIITENRKDFPAEIVTLFGIEAQHPDEFVLHLLGLAPGCALSPKCVNAFSTPIFLSKSTT